MITGDREKKKSKLFALKAPHSLGFMSKSLDFFKVWIFGQMNNIWTCAMEIVEREIIFV